MLLYVDFCAYIKFMFGLKINEKRKQKTEERNDIEAFSKFIMGKKWSRFGLEN